MWIDEFILHLFPHDPAQIDFDAAYFLKEQHIPPYLYKYRTFCTKSLDNLRTNTLWLSSPSNLNDPIDCSFTFDPIPMLRGALATTHEPLVIKYGLENYFTDDEFIALLKADDPIEYLFAMGEQKKLPGWEIIRKQSFKNTCSSLIKAMFTQLAQNFIEKVRNSVKIISLSAESDNNVLWSHYADGHKGFCIEYDFSSVPLNDYSRRFLYPVIYSTEYLNVTKYLSRGNKYFNVLYPIFAAMTKNIKWDYEKEWRIIISGGIFETEQNYKMPRICRILLGSRVSKENKLLAVSVAYENQIIIKQTEFDQKTGKIIISYL